jgi:glycosyltransferase involved in cell wall biosynthesis
MLVTPSISVHLPLLLSKLWTMTIALISSPWPTAVGHRQGASGQMHICYVLFSPTFGMHQYTADLANRMVWAGHQVSLVTTRHYPRDRYASGVIVHTPLTTTNIGLSLESLGLRQLYNLQRAIRHLQPDLVHVTAPHVWNPLLLEALRRAGLPTVHTLHDLHPHTGAAYGRLLLDLWNVWVQCAADHLLVHGQCYREELLAQNVAPSRVTCTPLTHLFLSYAQERVLVQSPPAVRYEPWALFFGRLEPYKGLDVLVEAASRIGHSVEQAISTVIAGQGRLEGLARWSVPPRVEVRNRLIDDEEAVDLFSRCGLVVLPYTEASQSALVAAAYFFRKPVIVSRVGALPEYVVEEETGWVIPPSDPQALAEALQAALSDPARLAWMGHAGRAWYESQRQDEGVVLRRMHNSLARTTQAPFINGGC